MDDSQIGFLIQIGEGAFTLQYVAGMRYSDYMEVAPQALERAFSAACQMLDVDDISLVYERALDAVLRITGFEKGYYFSIEDTELTMESARRLDMSYLDMRFCSFSQMSIQDAIARNDIYLMNVENDGSGNMTKSMQVLGLRKTMCVPVGDGNSRPSGAIYADTQRNTLLSPALFKPALRMLSKMVAFKLRSFGTGNLQQKEDIYDR